MNKKEVISKYLLEKLIDKLVDLGQWKTNLKLIIEGTEFKSGCGPIDTCIRYIEKDIDDCIETVTELKYLLEAEVE